MLERKTYTAWICSSLLLMAWVSLGITQENRPIVQIAFQGLQRVPESTARYYVQTREGNLYDPAMIRADFRSLWRSGLFQDLRVEVDETTEGVRVVFHVKEKPVIEEVVWPQKLKPLRLEDIQSKLSEEGVALFAGDLYDPYRAFQAQQAIRRMLAEKGYRFPEIRVTPQPVSPTAVRLVWTIEPGENVRVGTVAFEGNEAFSDGKLRRVFPIKATSLLNRILGKDKYDPSKLEKGMEKLREFYYNRGYLDFRVGEPRVEVYTRKGGKRRLRIVIPVEEGPRYRIGEIRFEGNRVFSERELLKMLDIQPGQWFQKKRLQKTLEFIHGEYGRKGYIFVTVAPDIRPRVEEQQYYADITFRIREGKPQRIRRIEFQGNTYTHDLVIRRNLDIEEGHLLNTEFFRRSLQRIYRLGYFDKVEPDIRRVEGSDDHVDVIIKVHESRRNEIQAGGGYSELYGFFGQFAFATRNLFGTGKSLSFAAQVGGRIQSYQISYVDPYFWNSDWQVGVDIYNTWSNLFLYQRRNRGGGILLGYPLVRRELFFRIGYSYTRISLENVNENLLKSGILGIRPEEVGDLLRRTDSRITPQLTYNTLNDPIEPTQGTFAQVSLGFAGGILGGDVYIIRPNIQWAQYWKVNRRGHYFAYNVEAGIVYSYGGRTVPFYERFYLGGDFSIRGYDFRTVGPIDPTVSRRFTVGGTKYALFNLEYVIPLGQSPLRLVLFWDGGNAFAPDEPLRLTAFRFSTGLEIRILLPVVNQFIRFIFARNWNRGPLDAPAWNFRFGFGRSF